MPLAITADTADFITLDEVRDHLNITSNDSDAELTFVSRAAQEHVEALVGPVRWREVTETRYDSSGSRYLLGTYPVVSLGQVAYDGAPFTGATLEPVGAVRGLGGYGALTITYTAGRAECPDDIRLATLIVVQHLWQTQLGNAPGRGALPANDGTEPVYGVGYAIPARAMDLLAPYLLPGGIG